MALSMSTATKLAPANYEDLLALPEHLVGEIINGMLYAHPRPTLPHARAATVLSGELQPPFGRGRGGPGGWIFLYEPELHLGPHVLVPDLAGWRRERMPELPSTPFSVVAPDWLCEILSPGTAAVDRSEKLPLYARQGVTHSWLVDPTLKTLEVYRLDGPTYRLVATHAGDASVHVEPFESFPLELGALWQP
jgi:Uma2 family endonuclease